MTNAKRQATEIIAVSSGKGGTGKTLIAASLGFALRKVGHRVLMIDGDPGTDGLSLMLLGPEGHRALPDFQEENTLVGILASFQKEGEVVYKPHPVNRREDHGVSYDILVSGRGIYGALAEDDWAFSGTKTGGFLQFNPVMPLLEPTSYLEAIARLFDLLRESSEYDYVLIDTRGGFSFESTAICALADSFLVVTEPDYTSFYQDRSLVDRIDLFASEARERLPISKSGVQRKKPVLRGILVNKATSGDEKPFRLALEREFRPKVKFSDTFAIPLDVAAIRAYRYQQIPFVRFPECPFSSSCLEAFSKIMRIVTSAWEESRVDGWIALSRKIRRARLSPRALGRYIREKLVAVILLLALGLVWGSTRSFLHWRAEQQVELSERVYSEDIPPSIRLSSLLSLYQDGRRSFQGVDLEGLDLSRLELVAIDLRRADLENTAFRAANLRGAQLTGASLRGADLEGASLSYSTLRDAVLGNANLRSASLLGADLAGADLRGADLRGADLRGANLKAAEVDPKQLQDTIMDKLTVLPFH